MGLASFIANDSLLSRSSGVSEQPMEKEPVVSFRSPKSLEVELKLPHAGLIQGMGTPKGITLIVGGGYHEKIHVIGVIESRIYNRIPQDGREYCTSLPHTIKVRSDSWRNRVKTALNQLKATYPHYSLIMITKLKNFTLYHHHLRHVSESAVAQSTQFPTNK